MLEVPRKKRPEVDYDHSVVMHDAKSFVLAVELGEVEDRALETIKLLSLLDAYPTRPTMSASEVRYRVFSVVKANLEELSILLGDHPEIFGVPKGLPEHMEILFNVSDLNDLSDETVELLITGLMEPLFDCAAEAADFFSTLIDDDGYDSIFSSYFFCGMEKRIAWHEYLSSAGESFAIDCEVWYTMYQISRAAEGASSDQARLKAMEILKDAQVDHITLGPVKLPCETQNDFEMRMLREELWLEHPHLYGTIRERGFVLAARGMFTFLWESGQSSDRGTRSVDVFYGTVIRTLWLSVGSKLLPHEAQDELTTDSRPRTPERLRVEDQPFERVSRTVRLRREAKWKERTNMSDEDRKAWQKAHYQQWLAWGAEEAEYVDVEQVRKEKRRMWVRARKELITLYNHVMTAQRRNRISRE